MTPGDPNSVSVNREEMSLLQQANRGIDMESAGWPLIWCCNISGQNRCIGWCILNAISCNECNAVASMQSSHMNTSGT